MNIWVIMGGASSEREVSLDSGRAVAGALRAAGHGVLAYDLDSGEFLAKHSSPEITAPVLPADLAWAERLLAAARALSGRADVAFLALHGGPGENGIVQALLEAAGFPYTGSGPAACAVTMDKILTKRVMETLRIATPAWAGLDVPAGGDGAPSSAPPEAPPAEWLASTPVGGCPAVVKPCNEGSSVGVAIARSAAEWPGAFAEAFRALGKPAHGSRQLLVEKYIPGRELTVGILQGVALPVVEIAPRSGFYDYARKYTAGETSYMVPAELPESIARQAQDWSVSLYNATGCYGMARVDFRLAPEGPPMCLELNTIPGMTALSLLPKAAGAAGIGFVQLIEQICLAALR